MMMRIFLVTLLSLLWSDKCQAQSQLPVKMPDKISFRLNEGGGMSRSYKKINIEEGKVQFEELIDNQSGPQKWTANISNEDIAGLYKVFFDNAFDQIENDLRKEIVYDAGSETISISIDKTKSYNVTFGKNSPLSGRNLRNFQKVRKAIYELIEKVKKQQIDISSEMSDSEAEQFLRGKWRAAGENSGHTWFLEWKFDNGKFKQVGYPPISQEGKYEIEKVEKGKIFLNLYDQKGTFGERINTVEIKIDNEMKKISISQMKFSRVFD